VVLLPKAIGDLLDLKPNDLRDKKLVQFNKDIVDRITIEPAGKEKLVLARNGKTGWVRKADKDIDVNATQVDRLLSDFAGANVTDFVADVATDLPKYGLDQPTVKVTLSSFSSENTAETKAGEKPIVTVLFGKRDNNKVYAKLDEDPFVLATPDVILDSIVTDPLQLQPLEIYKNKADDITSFEVVRPGQPTFAVERDKEKNWKLAKGDDKVNTINVQSLVNTLANLRAVRWMGATTPEHGLATPDTVVTFKTAGNTTGKLSLGATDSTEMRYAAAEGLTGTFLIPKPDYEAFVAQLLDKPVSAPAATPAPPAPAPGAAVPVKPEAASTSPASAPNAVPVPVPAPMPVESEKPKSGEAPAPGSPAAPQP